MRGKIVSGLVADLVDFISATAMLVKSNDFLASGELNKPGEVFQICLHESELNKWYGYGGGFWAA